MQTRENRSTSETGETAADTETGSDGVTNKTGEADAKSRIDESDDVKTDAFRKIGLATEIGATRATAAAETTSEAAGGQSETGEADAEAAAAVKEEVMMTTAGVEDSEIHTDVKESSASNINRCTTNTDIWTLHRAQPSTGVEAELLVERHELLAGNKEFENEKEHATSKEV